MQLYYYDIGYLMVIPLLREQYLREHMNSLQICAPIQDYTLGGGT